MPLTRSFKETVKARAGRDPAFRAALLGEAVEAFAAGDTGTAKALTRDAIDATVGFEELAREVAIDREDLMRHWGFDHQWFCLYICGVDLFGAG